MTDYQYSQVNLKPETKTLLDNQITKAKNKSEDVEGRSALENKQGKVTADLVIRAA